MGRLSTAQARKYEPSRKMLEEAQALKKRATELNRLAHSMHVAKGCAKTERWTKKSGCYDPAPRRLLSAVRKLGRMYDDGRERRKRVTKKAHTVHREGEDIYGDGEDDFRDPRDRTPPKSASPRTPSPDMGEYPQQRSPPPRLHQLVEALPEDDEWWWAPEADKRLMRGEKSPPPPRHSPPRQQRSASPPPPSPSPSPDYGGMEQLFRKKRAPSRRLNRADREAAEEARKLEARDARRRDRRPRRRSQERFSPS